MHHDEPPDQNIAKQLLACMMFAFVVGFWFELRRDPAELRLFPRIVAASCHGYTHMCLVRIALWLAWRR